MELQQGKCFYCEESIPSKSGHIDHFIPWAKYPIDLGHKFVLVCNRCNGKKRDRCRISIISRPGANVIVSMDHKLRRP